MPKLLKWVRVPLISGALALALFASFFAWSSNFSPLQSNAVSDAGAGDPSGPRPRSHVTPTPVVSCSGGGYGQPPQTCVTTTPPPSDHPTSPGPTGTPPGTFPSTPPPSSPGSTFNPVNPPSSPGPSFTTTVTTTATAIVRINRTISLEASVARVKFRSQFTLTGRITSSSAACVTGQPVQIQKTTFGTIQSVVFDNLITDSNGVFTATYTGDRSANYVARVDATPACSAAQSNSVPVLVKGLVRMRLSDRLVQRGARVRFKVFVLPCTNPRGSVALLQSRRGSFRNVGSKALSPACTATFARTIRRRTAFQAVWTSPVTDVQSAKSGIKTVRIRR